MMQLMGETQIDDAESQWWSRTNYQRMLNQWVKMEEVLTEDEYEATMEDARQQLDFGGDHIEQFETIVNQISAENESDASFYKYLPHQVGWHGNPYGRELRETDGWKSVEMTCAVLSNVQASIHWVNDPMVKDLRESFKFAVLIETTDQELLAHKVKMAQGRGLIRARN